MGNSNSVPEKNLGIEFSRGQVKSKNLHIYTLRRQEVVAQDIEIFVKQIARSQKKYKEKAAIIINLQQLDLDGQACSHLSRVEAKNLQKLNLEFNSVDPIGCYYLSQNKWNDLQQLSLKNNYVCNLGCKFIARFSKSMKRLYLSGNFIANEGCKYLSESKFKQLQKLGLSNNAISDKGTYSLSKAEWVCLEVLHLGTIANRLPWMVGVLEVSLQGRQNLSEQLSRNSDNNSWQRHPYYKQLRYPRPYDWPSIYIGQ